MTAPRPENEAIFHAARDIPDADRRRAYVREACDGDEARVGHIEAMLAAAAAPDSLLDRPAGGVPAATVDYRPAESPGATIGHYKLIEQIGEGGMGAVWVAQQTEPVRRTVAVKLIRAGMDSKQVLARFGAERQALALMDHPNIAKVFDGGATADGRPYFVMELVKGVPITQFCDDRKLTPRQRLELFVPVCHAIQHAHQKGVIHRDIKPSNVLVALYDDRPVAKVIDFGVAKATGPQFTDATVHTGFGAVVGTVEYMSPEQAGFNQLDIDTRSDVYSLGVLLYELLAGTPPFTRKELVRAGVLEMLRVIREQEPSRPSIKLSTAEGLPTLAANRGTEPAKLSRLVRGELDWIVMRALEKDRSRRYETANGFAADVQRYLSDEPVQACPPSVGYRVRKFARRNKGGLVVAALVLLFLMVIGSGFGWAVRDRAAREAEAARQRGERHAKAGVQVESIFAEVDRLEVEQKWPEALAAARRAEAIVAGGEVDAATAERVRDRLKELELVDRLDQVRVKWVTGNGLSLTDQEYARAFRDHGVDLDGLTVEASVERLKAWPALIIPLAASLDDWIYVRHQAPDRDAADWKRLVAVARGIDPEPLRDRLRSTWDQPAVRTRDELGRLAESIDVRAHHPTTLVNLARTLLHQVDLPDHAVRVLRDARHAYPGDFWLNEFLGLALGERQYHEGAIRFLTAATSIRPDSAVAHYNLGVFLGRQERRDEAIAAYRKAIEINPREFDAYRNLAVSLRRQKRLDEAAAAYRKLIELYPDNIRARVFLGDFLRAQGKVGDANGVYDQAIELARGEIKRQSKPGSRLYLNVGYVLESQGKRDEAIEEYRKAVEADPKNFDAHLQLATALRAQGRRDEAIAAFRKAIGADPIRGGRYRSTVGDLLREQGKLDEASAAYREAIDARPSDANAYNGLGLVLREQKPDEAIAMFRKAIEMDPTSGGTHINLGNLLRKQGKMDDAVTEFRTAIALDSKATNANVVGTAYFCLGETLHDQKWLAESIAAFAKAIELEPRLAASVNYYIEQMRKDKDFAAPRDREDFKKLVAAVEARRPLNDRAWDLATDPDPSRRDPAQAVALAEKAVAELPKDANCWNTLGAARYRAGDYKGAVAALLKYRELRKDDAEWTNPFFLAMAHWKLGEKPEARQWFDKGVEWMERKKVKTGITPRLRTEAAKLLGIEKHGSGDR